MTDKPKRGPGRPRKSARQEPPTPPLDTPDDEETDDELDELGLNQEEITSIERVLAEYGEDAATANVSRWDGGVWVFLDKFSVAEVSPAEIKTRYGGGKYLIKLLDARNKYRKSITFRIAGKPKEPVEEPAGIDPNLTGIDRVLARLDSLEKKGSDSTTNEILKLVVAAALRPPPQPVTPPRDPLMETLITALIAGKSNGAGAVDQVAMLKLVADAEKRGEDRGTRLGEALAAAAGEGDGVARVLASTLPQVIDAFGKAQQSYRSAAAAAISPRPTATARVAQPTAPGEPTAPTTEGDEVNGKTWIGALRPAVPIILQWANTNKDPQVKAANTVDDLNDNVREMIAEQAEEPTFVTDVIAAIPEFQAPPNVRNWATIFLSTVQEILTTAVDESPTGESSTAEA